MPVLVITWSNIYLNIYHCKIFMLPPFHKRIMVYLHAIQHICHQSYSLVLIYMHSAVKMLVTTFLGPIDVQKWWIHMYLKIHTWLVLWNMEGNLGEHCEHVSSIKKYSFILMYLHYACKNDILHRNRPSCLKKETSLVRHLRPKCPSTENLAWTTYLNKGVEIRILK